MWSSLRSDFTKWTTYIKIDNDGRSQRRLLMRLFYKRNAIRQPRQLCSKPAASEWYMLNNQLHNSPRIHAFLHTILYLKRVWDDSIVAMFFSWLYPGRRQHRATTGKREEEYTFTLTSSKARSVLSSTKLRWKGITFPLPFLFYFYLFVLHFLTVVANVIHIVNLGHHGLWLWKRGQRHTHGSQTGSKIPLQCYINGTSSCCLPFMSLEHFGEAGKGYRFRWQLLWIQLLHIPAMDEANTGQNLGCIFLYCGSLSARCHFCCFVVAKETARTG